MNEKIVDKSDLPLYVQMEEAIFCEQMNIDIKSEFREFKQWFVDTDNVPIYRTYNELYKCYKRFLFERYRHEEIINITTKLEKRNISTEDSKRVAEKIWDLAFYYGKKDSKDPLIDEIISLLIH